jgi:bacterioferritin-associated ferredoxin
MLRHQRTFIEAVVEDVREAKEVLMPALMAETPDEPWSAASIGRLRGMRAALDPLMREAADLLLAFELPFVEEEERLAAQGMTLERDMAGFEVAMVDFERAFWEARYAEYRADPERWRLRERPTYDLCREHRLDSDRVRRAIRDHRPATFEEIAPLLGTSPACSACHVGVTRLLIQEVRRQKSGAA